MIMVLSNWIFFLDRLDTYVRACVMQKRRMRRRRRRRRR